jgi:dipeptide/tripeptide permease
MVTLGKNLILLGAVIIAVGMIILAAPKIPYLGKLPGDIHIKKGNFEFYFPLATSIVVSVIISGILWLISHGSKK